MTNEERRRLIELEDKVRDLELYDSRQKGIATGSWKMLTVIAGLAIFLGTIVAQFVVAKM